MTIFEAFLLGIIQGLTEFFPVSSSAHLILFQHFFGLEGKGKYMLFDVVCHLGTLFVILFYFRKKIYRELIISHRLRFPLLLSTIMLLPIAFFHKKIGVFFEMPYIITIGFLITALNLFCISLIRKEKEKALSLTDSSLLGLTQALAVFPGISRSGSTIAVGRFLGLKTEDALTFSFLMAIPAILGAAILETSKLFSEEALTLANLEWVHYGTGFTTSLVVGFFSLAWLSKIAKNYRWSWFSFYCLGAAFFAFLYRL